MPPSSFFLATCHDTANNSGKAPSLFVKVLTQIGVLLPFCSVTRTQPPLLHKALNRTRTVIRLTRPTTSLTNPTALASLVPLTASLWTTPSPGMGKTRHLAGAGTTHHRMQTPQTATTVAAMAAAVRGQVEALAGPRFSGRWSSVAAWVPSAASMVPAWTRPSRGMPVAGGWCVQEPTSGTGR